MTPSVYQPKDLAGVLEKLNKKLEDPELFTAGSDNNWSNISGWISTGSTLLDIVMTSFDKDGQPVGSGWALGRWYEVFGEEASGKSTLIEHAIAETQKANGIPGLIDSESKFYKPRAQRIGVDLQKLVMCNAPYFERGVEAFNTFVDFMQKSDALAGRPLLWAWDTIAAVDTKADYESGEYSGGMADKARKAHAMFRDLTTKLAGYRACFILVNQVRDNIGAGKYEKQTDTTGGRGAKFFASARIEVQKFGVYTDPDNKELPQGIMTRFKFAKSSLFKPYAEVELPVNYETGIDNIMSLVQFHCGTKYILNKSGNYYCPDYYGEAATGKRLGAFLAAVREDELFQDVLKREAWKNAGLLWKKSATYAAPKDSK